MPYVFIDDGGPEANDYASNYAWIDPAPAAQRSGRSTPLMSWWLAALSRLMAARGPSTASAARAERSVP